jgi:SAM-dependent methyltransferase
MLEIGCGDGNFLAVLRRAGWEVQGSEFGADVAALVQRRHQIPVFVGELAEIPLDRPFPVIAAYHVLEHVYHPVEWLQRIHRLLEADGLLHLQVPNVAAITQYVTGRACASIVFPQHVYFYTPATLQSLLERTGFTTVATATWDPWHGPGVVANSLIYVAHCLTTGRLPWTDRLEPPSHGGAGSPVPAADRRVWRSLARGILDGVSVPLARAEAAVGHGAVVDIIARRRDGSQAP